MLSRYVVLTVVLPSPFTTLNIDNQGREGFSSEAPNVAEITIVYKNQ